MRHAPVTFTATILLALFCASWSLAAQKNPPIRPQPIRPTPQPAKPNPPPQPVKPQPRPHPAKPNPPVGNLTNSPHTVHKPPHRDSYHSNHHVHNYARAPYVIYGAYPYYDQDDYYYVYPYPYSRYYLPPAYIPAEQYFGPYAAMRVFGMVPTQPTMNANTGPWRDDDDFEPKKSADRATNAQAIALALKFIGYGDALFAQQKYAAANDRYRKASNSTPQLADAWFRQGFAMSAAGRYDLALGAFKRGMKLDPKWPKSGFEIDELYGKDGMSKTAHLDALANVAEGKPNDSDLLFLIGVRLHFDGQAERAKTFFKRADQLAGDDSNPDHIRAFLKK